MIRSRMTMSLLWCLAITALLPVCGCVSKSTAEAQARAAYMAGQKDAYAKIVAEDRTNITVVGDVKSPKVPWVEGMTLAQAIATADYTGIMNPKEITLMRRGQRAAIDPKNLLNGHDVPLEPGDTIFIQ
jgi:protein involved in polysaccharide export with SLBB domain